MAEHLLPAALALFLWWFTTGAILYLDGMRRETFRVTLVAATAVLALSAWSLHATARDATPAGAVLAFCGGLLAWGWLELTFLTGFLTGPERRPCPAGLRGWPRFRRATLALLHHEVAILLVAAGSAALTWDAPNQVGPATVAVLWGMRVSAKLNLFLGVRNRNAEFLPDHMRYLGSYFGAASSNALLPVSLIAATATATLLLAQAFAPGADPFRATARTLLGTLVALGALEHLLMVVPLPATALWGWGFRSRAWSTELEGSCDPSGLERLLQAVAHGSFGRVDRLQGEARAGNGWVRFDVAGGRPSLAAMAPRDDGAQRVFAVGRVDGSRLRAAFEACTAA